MPEKSVSPLNNPVSQKSADDDVYMSPSTASGGKGVRQGGEGARPVIYMLLRCRQCRKEQQITFFHWTPPKMHICIGCGEKQPTQGYAVIAHANYPLG